MLTWGLTYYLGSTYVAPWLADKFPNGVTIYY